MWERVVAGVRKAGPKKLAAIAAVAVVAVILAYGNNSTNDAASGKTLPRVGMTSAPYPSGTVPRP